MSHSKLDTKKKSYIYGTYNRKDENLQKGFEFSFCIKQQLSTFKYNEVRYEYN